jgi:hypothetical protein
MKILIILICSIWANISLAQDIDAPKVFKTSFGPLVVKGSFPMQVTFNNKIVKGLIGEEAAILSDDVKVYKLKDSEVLLFNWFSGNACPSTYNVLTIFPNGTFKVGMINGFGTCGELFQVSQNEDTIMIGIHGSGMNGLGADLGGAANRKALAKEAKKKYFWKYQNGTVTEVKK